MTPPTIHVTNIRNHNADQYTIAWCDIRIGPLLTRSWRIYRTRTGLRCQPPPGIVVEDVALDLAVRNAAVRAVAESADAVDVLLGGKR